MMTRKITMMALVGGVVLGAAATAGFNVYRQSHDSRIFQERLGCQSAADAYIKKENADLDPDPTDPYGNGLTLLKADYSPARNSCIAEVEMTIYLKHRGMVEGVLQYERVQDLLSDETLFSANSRDDDLDAFSIFLPQVWDYVMNNASQPVELENAWALIQSKNPPQSAQDKINKSNALQALIDPKNPPKSTPPSGHPPIDPATGERIPASQGKSASSSGP